MNAIEWNQVRRLFEEHGCVMIGHPEMRWYQESWEALEKAGLTSIAEFEQFELGQTVLKLRTLCLLAMYLGMYQAAGKFSELGGHFSEHPPSSWYLHTLNVTMEEIWELARLWGILETECSSYWEDEEVDDEYLREIAADLVSENNDSIFRVLEEHFGGNVGLFVSIWNSRLPLDQVEPPENVVNTGYQGDGKLEVWTYVEEGMTSWSWS